MISLFTKSSKSGFTLIELLVVVSIIGLLASIVVVSLGGSREKSRNVKRIADLRQIQQAFELCYNDVSCGKVSDQHDYPTLTTCATIGTNVEAMSKYMAQAPSDPIGTGEFVYTCFSKVGNYCLSAKIEGAEGGSTTGATWTYVSQAGTQTGKGKVITDEACTPAA